MKDGGLHAAVSGPMKKRGADASMRSYAPVVAVGAMAVCYAVPEAKHAVFEPRHAGVEAQPAAIGPQHAQLKFAVNWQPAESAPAEQGILPARPAAAGIAV